MEPSLYDGDVLLVRKSDFMPNRLWQYWASQADDGTDAGDECQNALRVMAHDVQSDRPIGEFWTKYTYLHPPTIHVPGSVLVFRAPDAEKFPSAEYRVKRVIGLGGQIVRSGETHFDLRRVPNFSLWVEGDNYDEYDENQTNPKAQSVDSRTYGAISKNLVIGVAERVIWPPSRWGVIPCVTSPAPRAWWP